MASFTADQIGSFRSGAKLLDNGYYKVSYGEGDLYLSADADLSNLSFYCYNPGSYATGGDGGRGKLNSIMQSNDPLQFDVIYVSKYSTTTDKPQNLVSDLDSHFDATITNATFEGWSGGVGGAFENTCLFVEKLTEDNPNVVVNMVGVDALISGGYDVTAESDRQKLRGKYAKYIEILKKYNVNFYTLGEEYGGQKSNSSTLASVLAEFGLNAKEIAIDDMVKHHGVGHTELFRLSLETKLLPALAGLTSLSEEEIKYLSFEGTEEDKWEWHIYVNGDRENGEIDLIDFLGAMLSSKFASIQNLNINSKLSDALAQQGNDIILSNLELVISRMNDIRGVIKGMVTAPASSFSTTAPAFLGACISSYGDAASTLMESLLSETESVVSHAEGIATIDAKFADDITDNLLREISDKYNGK